MSERSINAVPTRSMIEKKIGGRSKMITRMAHRHSNDRST
jgi:hypothetical protein